MRRTLVPSVNLRAMERWAATRPKGSVRIWTHRGKGSTLDADNDPDLTVQETQLWLDVPSRWRYELETHGYGTAVNVVDPPLWWSYAPSLHAFSNEADPGALHASAQHPEWHLFHASELQRGLTITARRVEQRDGREVEIVDGTGDPGGGLMPGADAYELVIDRERDIAIRTSARYEGIEYTCFEIIEIEFDTVLPAGLFRVELPPGVTFTAPPAFDRTSRFRRFLRRFPLRWRGPQFTSRRER
ncbi:MAG: hypothetical protein M3R54_07490 [Chloroflexota bacterium]|nr:hypothetical protein [Chloroflexota bacterium]